MPQEVRVGLGMYNNNFCCWPVIPANCTRGIMYSLLATRKSYSSLAIGNMPEKMYGDQGSASSRGISQTYHIHVLPNVQHQMEYVVVPTPGSQKWTSWMMNTKHTPSLYTGQGKVLIVGRKWISLADTIHDNYHDPCINDSYKGVSTTSTLVFKLSW